MDFNRWRLRAVSGFELVASFAAGINLWVRSRRHRLRGDDAGAVEFAGFGADGGFEDGGGGCGGDGVAVRLPGTGFEGEAGFDLIDAARHGG